MDVPVISLAQQWDRLKQPPLNNYNTRTAASSDETGRGMEDTDESVELVSRSCSTC